MSQWQAIRHVPDIVMEGFEIEELDSRIPQCADKKPQEEMKKPSSGFPGILELVDIESGWVVALSEENGGLII